jgi:hypothetical protein
MTHRPSGAVRPITVSDLAGRHDRSAREIGSAAGRPRGARGSRRFAGPDTGVAAADHRCGGAGARSADAFASRRRRSTGTDGSAAFARARNLSKEDLRELAPEIDRQGDAPRRGPGRCRASLAGAIRRGRPGRRGRAVSILRALPRDGRRRRTPARAGSGPRDRPGGRPPGRGACRHRRWPRRPVRGCGPRPPADPDPALLARGNLLEEGQRVGIALLVEAEAGHPQQRGGSSAIGGPGVRRGVSRLRRSGRRPAACRPGRAPDSGGGGCAADERRLRRYRPGRRGQARQATRGSGPRGGRRRIRRPPAILEGHHQGDARDAQRLRDVRRLVGVELGQEEGAVPFGGEFLEDGPQLAARAAPGGPEIDDDGEGFRFFDDLRLEVGVR